MSATVRSLTLEEQGISFYELKDEAIRQEITLRVKEVCGGMKGAAMGSDAFFPFKDGIEIGLKEGVSAVIQPGGSERDFESIDACNQHGATMVYTGQRCFKH